jgi:hypothetical protein
MSTALNLPVLNAEAEFRQSEHLYAATSHVLEKRQRRLNGSP